MATRKTALAAEATVATTTATAKKSEKTATESTKKAEKTASAIGLQGIILLLATAALVGGWIFAESKADVTEGYFLFLAAFYFLSEAKGKSITIK